VRRASLANNVEVIAKQVLAVPTIDYGRLVKPLWLRMENDNGSLQAAISNDGATWFIVGTIRTSRTDLRAGFFLVSGIDGVVTEVCFDSVSVTTA
jgi:hypothetical protein